MIVITHLRWSPASCGRRRPDFASLRTNEDNPRYNPPMKAIVVRAFGEPEVMQLEEVSDPFPGETEVRLRVRAAGVNPVDTYIRAGTSAQRPALPYTPGSDVAGVVDLVGSRVTRVKKGDRVYAYAVTGGYAELVVCPEAVVRPLPDLVSVQQGAALGVPYGTAWRALFGRAQAKAGEAVLVHGASGGVGTAAVQIARAHGLTVIGTAGTPAGLRLVAEQGAHHVLNHRVAGYLDAISSLTAGKGVDIVLEMLANVNLDRDLDALALRGRVVVIGSRGRIEIDPRKTMTRDAAILGLLLFNAAPDELREIHEKLAVDLKAGLLKPVIARELALADAAKAHAAVLQPGAMGKIVLIP
jgi:NADPH2:quinone reductase